MSVHRCLYYSLTLVMIAAWTTHSSASIVTGQTVGFDFGSIAPAANPTQTFNQIDLFNNSLANGATFTFLTDPNLNGGATSTQLVDFTNTAVTGVGFTITNSTGQNTSRANVTNGTAGPAPFNNSTVFQDSLISNNQGVAPLATGGFFTLTFSGLDDSIEYDLTGGYDGNNANFDSILSADGQTQPFAPGANNYVTLSGLQTDGSGNLAITVTRDTLHANIGALTLTGAAAIAVPEPSSFALLGVGFVGLLTRRRRS